MKRIWMSIVISAALAVGAFTGCASAATTSSSAAGASASAPMSMSASMGASQSSTENLTPVTTGQNVPDTMDEFTDRDLQQEADLSNAKQITVKSGEDVTITEEGVYVLSGTAENTTIVVNANDTAKVQLVLDGLTIANDSAPAIYVASADKAFVTTAAGSTNSLTVKNTFAYSADEKADAAVYAKDDLTLNGKGTLVINSSGDGIASNDTVKVTGGTYQITAVGHGIKGNDSVAIADGSFAINAETDGIHAANDEDQSKGYVYIAGGTFELKTASDGIEGDAFVKIDGGTFTIEAEEGIDGSYIQINDGTIGIDATDDGINASVKSNVYNTMLEINGGNVTVNMAQGDTDALDSNGGIVINGGTVAINGQSPFDFNTTGALNGGTVTVNGQQVTEITASMMGGGQGGRGGMGSSGAAPSGMGSSGAAPNGMSGDPRSGKSANA